MQIVINIPEKMYNEIVERENHSTVDSLILDGIPLPEHHGRLKDIDKIISDGISKAFCDWYDEMKYAPTIIEADKEEE